MVLLQLIVTKEAYAYVSNSMVESVKEKFFSAVHWAPVVDTSQQHVIYARAGTFTAI